jgi:cold shock protein
MAREDGVIGMVKWWTADRGFGFIRPDDGTEDVIVHVSAVKASGVVELREGERKLTLDSRRNLRFER